MKRKVAATFIIVLVTLIFGGFLFPTQTYAAGDMCKSFSFWVGDVCGLVGTLIYTIPVTLASWILWLGGQFLNSVLHFTVVDLSKNINQISGINIAWSLIRDLANISFIFVLLHVAISTVLGIGKDWKKTVVNVVAAAILINFSLFFTKVIIDASNIIALTFYNQIVPGADIKLGLSNYFLQPLGLAGFFGPGTIDSVLASNAVQYDFGKLLVMSVGTSIFFLTTAFVFFAAAFMFVVRFVNIIYLLILSPLAVIGSAVSGASGQSKKWFETLSSQMIFAPVFMIMTWAAITILNAGGMGSVAAGGVSSTAQFSNLFNNSTGTQGAFGLMVNFALIIGIIIGVLTTSKSIANQGGSWAQKVVSGAVGYGVSGVGLAGRQSVGRIGKVVSDNKNLQAREGDSRLARLALKTSRGAASGSFDVRESRFNKFGSAITGEDIGIGGKAGGKGGVIEDDKKVKEFFAMPGSDAYKARMDRVTKAQTSIDISRGSSSSATPAEVNKLQSRLSNMSPKQAEQLSVGTLKKDPVATNMSSQQFEAVMKSDKLDDQDKTAVKNARFKKIYTEVRAGNATAAKDEIGNLTKEELETVDADIITNTGFIETLKDSQVTKILDSNKFTPAQKQSIKDARTQPLKSVLTAGVGGGATNPAAARDIVKKIKQAKDLAQLMNVDIAGQPALTHREILPVIKQGMLKRLTSELSSADIQKIRDAFDSAATSIRIAAPTGAYTPDQQSIINTDTWIKSPVGQSDFS